jgi:nucleoside-diphosphate-sugar epimerase
MVNHAFDGQTVAVTGAAGFLGGRLIQRLAATRCRILRVTRRPLPPVAARTPEVTDVVGDLGDPPLWERVVNEAGVVFHFAAQTSSVSAAENPDADFAANVVPMRHLVAASRKLNRQPMVVFAGTVTQAGIPSRIPVDEDAPDVPVTVYDRHKLIAESDLTSAALAGTVLGATLRLANVYGPGAPGHRADRDVLNRMIKAAVAGETLTVYGSGEFVRDYIFIDDAVEAFMMAAIHAPEVNTRHFVVGSGSGISILGAFELIASRVEALTGRHVPVTLTEPPSALPAIERRNFVANSARFIAATGWRPTHSLAAGIDRTIEAYACA